MVQSKSALIVLVGICLAWGAVACDNGRSEEPAPFHELCARYQRCHPNDFVETYGTLNNCENAERTYAQQIGQEFGPDCYSALLDLYRCWAAVTCAQNPDQVCTAVEAVVDQECS